MFLGTASENFPQSPPPRKKFGNVPEYFWGLLPKISPKGRLPEKNSGTFPSVFGDCFRKVPPKSASPKKIQECSRVFLGTASENFPQSPPPRKKFGNSKRNHRSDLIVFLRRPCVLEAQKPEIRLAVRSGQTLPEFKKNQLWSARARAPRIKTVCDHKFCKLPSRQPAAFFSVLLGSPRFSSVLPRFFLGSPRFSSVLPRFSSALLGYFR